jgi:DNA-binding transcriptional LysR family regulator
MPASGTVRQRRHGGPGFERGSEIIKISPTGPLVATTIELVLSTAIQGLGVIHVFEEYLEPALAGGALECVFQDWTQSFPGPLLYYPSRRHMPSPLRAFVDFVKDGQKSRRKAGRHSG